MRELRREWTKMDLINHLAKHRGYSRYLEICTSTTGNLFQYADRSRLQCSRLIYNSPKRPNDGLNVDYHARDLDISKCLEKIRRQQRQFDIILVDPWHAYRESLRDLREAFDMLAPGGTIVVHDCIPPNEAIAGPRFKKGAWCGVTYKAFIDFVLERPELWYCTVNTDRGCGIIQKAPFSGVRIRVNPGVRTRWQNVGRNYRKAFDLLNTHAGELLNIKSVREFVNRESRRSSARSSS